MSEHRDKYPDVFRTTRGLDLSGLGVVRERVSRTPVPTVVPGQQMPGDLGVSGISRPVTSDLPMVSSTYVPGSLLDLADVRSTESAVHPERKLHRVAEAEGDNDNGGSRDA